MVSRDLEGYYELTDDQESVPFRNFSQVPNIDLRNPNLKFLDLNRDGKADMPIDEEQVFTWFASPGKEGFDAYKKAAKSFNDEKGPVTIYDTATQSIALADMSGDATKRPGLPIALLAIVGNIAQPVPGRVTGELVSKIICVCVFEIVCGNPSPGFSPGRYAESAARYDCFKMSAGDSSFAGRAMFSSLSPLE